MNDSLPQTALVRTLPPSPELTNSHHGPENYHYYRRNTAYEDGVPRYFNNPWPSYRSPSLGDAYRAYNLGAAIAHPAPRKLAGLHRTKSGISINEGSHPLKCEDGEEAPRLEKKGWLPEATYVRPIFAEVFEDDDEEEDWRDPPVRVVQPQWGGVGDKGEKETVTWLGHAGVLVQVPWRNESRDGMCGVLFDPIFSYRCSPSQYVGPARHVEPPCSVSLLPEIHVCCISHDHYDHLDYYTIMDLWKYHQKTIHFLVPLALKPWFVSSGIPEDRVTELDWWSETLLTFPSPTPPSPSAPTFAAETWESTDLVLKFAFTPAQHRSGRGLLDHMKTLWGSWVFGVVGKPEWERREERGMKDWTGFKCFFGGDTGYRYATAASEGDDDAICPAFAEIASHYAPVSLSLLPLNTGSSLPFLRTILSLSLDQYTLTSSQHCSPGDSLEIHRIMRAERSVGMHWGTFCDRDESRGTRVEFGRGRRERGVGKRWTGEEVEERGEEGRGRFVLADIGETLVFP